MQYSNFIKSAMLTGHFTDKKDSPITIQFYETEIFVWEKYIIPIVRKTLLEDVIQQQGFGQIEMSDFERYFKLSRTLAKKTFHINEVNLGNSDMYNHFKGHTSKCSSSYDSLDGYENSFNYGFATQHSIDNYAKRRQFYRYLCLTNSVDRIIFEQEHERLKSTKVKYSDARYQRFCKVRRVIPYGLARIHSIPLEIRETIKGSHNLAIFSS